MERIKEIFGIKEVVWYMMGLLLHLLYCAIRRVLKWIESIMEQTRENSCKNVEIRGGIPVSHADPFYEKGDIKIVKVEVSDDEVNKCVKELCIESEKDSILLINDIRGKMLADDSIKDKLNLDKYGIKRIVQSRFEKINNYGKHEFPGVLIECYKTSYYNSYVMGEVYRQLLESKKIEIPKYGIDIVKYSPFITSLKLHILVLMNDNIVFIKEYNENMNEKEYKLYLTIDKEIAADDFLMDTKESKEENWEYLKKYVENCVSSKLKLKLQEDNTTINYGDLFGIEDTMALGITVFVNINNQELNTVSINELECIDGNEKVVVEKIKLDEKVIDEFYKLQGRKVEQASKYTLNMYKNRVLVDGTIVRR